MSLGLELDGHVCDAELDDHQLGGLVHVLPRPPLREDREVGLIAVPAGAGFSPRQERVGGLGGDSVQWGQQQLIFQAKQTQYGTLKSDAITAGTRVKLDRR